MSRWLPPLALIGVPSSAGARHVGLERGPDALLAAGLIEALRAAGRTIGSTERLPEVVSAPDPLAPRCQNLPLVAAVARMLAARVTRALAAGALPVVLGGDCTITLGAVAGAVGRGDLGLVYFDGDLDLNTPEESPSGILDGMVLAHLLGHGEAELARIGGPFPLLREPQVAVFGYEAESAHVDPQETRRLSHSSLRRFEAGLVRRDPEAAARAALRMLAPGVERVLVHFDVDVMGAAFGAADVAHDGGLTRDQAAAALRVFVDSDRFAGLVVTEYNPGLDPHLQDAKRLVALIAEAFTSERPFRPAASSRDSVTH